jgi:hypothetical protein
LGNINAINPEARGNATHGMANWHKLCYCLTEIKNNSGEIRNQSKGGMAMSKLLGLSATGTFVAVLLYGVMITPVISAAQPAFKGCICFDPAVRLDRQQASTDCEDGTDSDPFASGFRKASLRPLMPGIDPNTCSCGIQGTHEVKWACYGIGGKIIEEIKK